MTHPIRSITQSISWIGLALVLASCTGPAPSASQPAVTPTSAAAQATAVVSQPTPAQPNTAQPTVARPTAQPSPQAQAPACGPNPALTVAQTEGPYYKANPPRRSSLVEPGVTGTKLILTGFVLTSGCQPVRNAIVDVWQADAQGQYDNSGYRLRGYVTTDDSGRYLMETIMPGLYPGRTRHIHVKVRPPGQPELTTQVYFPNEPQNQRDSIFDQRLVVTMQGSGDGQTASYNFIVRG